LITIVNIYGMKSKFSERLKDLRVEKRLSQRALALEIQVSAAIISQWENGLKQPTADNILALSDFFDVSCDYLLGRED